MFSLKTRWYFIFSDLKELEERFNQQNQFTLNLTFGQVIFIKKGDEIFAFRNKCPHQNKSLLGCTIDEKLECPWHKYRFDINTGRGHGMALDKYELDFNEKGVFLGREYFSIF